MLLNPPLIRHNQTYPDASQVQSNQPIWPQEEVPPGVHVIQLSWDRSARNDGAYMRIVVTDLFEDGQDPDEKIPHPYHFKGEAKRNTWWFKEYLGHAKVLGTSNTKGFIVMRAGVRITNETLTLYRAPGEQPHPVLDPRYIQEKLEPTYNRLCYRREYQDWRIRNERKPWNDPDALRFTRGYIGDLFAEKNKDDPYGHIFHKGSAWLDTDGVCHLWDESLLYE